MARYDLKSASWQAWHLAGRQLQPLGDLPQSRLPGWGVFVQANPIGERAIPGFAAGHHWNALRDGVVCRRLHKGTVPGPSSTFEGFMRGINECFLFVSCRLLRHPGPKVLGPLDRIQHNPNFSVFSATLEHCIVIFREGVCQIPQPRRILHLRMAGNARQCFERLLRVRLLGKQPAQRPALFKRDDGGSPPEPSPVADVPKVGRDLTDTSRLVMFGVLR